jgi:hypothetical protein
MPNLANVTRDYRNINRVDISPAQAGAFDTAIDSGTISEAQFVASQIAGAKQTTQAEVATYAFLTGNTPSSAQLDSLVTFAKAQTAYYQAQGYQANLAPFEALGAAIVSDATTKIAFLSKYPASLSNTDFISVIYTGVTGGTAPVFTGVPGGSELTNGDHFIKQLAFYTNLYQSTGLSAADAALQARGAIAGQIVALAFIDPNVAATSTLDDQTVTFLTQAAAGTAVYGAPLPTTGTAGKTIVLTNNIDAPGAAAPSADTNGTNGDDTYLGASGTFATGDVLNGQGGNDILKYTSTTAAGDLVLANVSNIETYSVTSAGGGAELNLLNSSGYKLLESSGGSAAVKFSSVGTIADAHIANTTNAAGTADFNIVYAAATVAGTADIQKVAIDNAAVNTLTLAGIETIALTTSGKNTVANIVDTSLKSVTSAGAGALTATFDATDAAMTSFDASAATGAQKITFNAVSDVAVKGGSANDVFTFGATFTSKDTVDGGAGIDTVALNGSDISLATNETTKGINAFTNVEQVDFTGATATIIDQATLTNSAITKIIFDTTAADTVNNANGTTIFATGNAHVGAETFVMKGGVTTLNLALEGTAQNTVTGTAFVGSDITTLNTGSALTVKLSSTGVDSLKVTNTDFNDIGTITNTAGATFTVTGDANTTLGQTAGFAAAVNLDASALTGRLFATGSAGADFIKGGTNVNDITGAGGIDNIDISASSTKIDTIHLNGIVAYADRDAVAGFTTGTGGDLLAIAIGDTFASTAAGAPIAIQALGTQAGAQTFLVATNDLLAFNFNLSGNTIGAATTDATTSQALLDAVGTITVNNATGTGYILAYQSGNAYLFHEDGNAANLTAANIHLVGTLTGVAAGSATTADFLLQA